MNTRIITLCLLTISSVSAADETPAYTAALAAYTEEKLLGSAELERIIAACEQGAVANPFARDEADLDTSKWHAHETLEQFVKHGNLNAAQICVWAKKTRTDQLSKRREREASREDTAIAWEYDPPTLAVGYECACAVQHDGGLICWNAKFEFHLSAADGPVRTVSLFRQHGIILKKDGTLRHFDIGITHKACSQERNDDGRYVCELSTKESDVLTLNQVGPLRSVSMGGRDVCGVKDDWTVVCSLLPEYRGTRNGTPLDVLPPNLGLVRTALMSVGPYSRFACVLQIDGQAICWGDATGVNLVRDKEEVRAIAVSSNLCVIRENNTVSCNEMADLYTVFPGGKEVAFEKDPGAVRTIAAGSFNDFITQGATCAIQEAGDVVCWSDKGRALSGIAGPASRIAVGLDKACASLEDGRLTCWNLFYRSNLDGNSLAAPANLKMKSP